MLNATSTGTPPDAATLVRDDRVHSRIFTDPEIFRIEIERIFRRTWLFALHESEIPETGDFKTLTLAGSPVVAVRDKDGAIRLFLNRCRHRGAQVCEYEHGNTSFFRCWYHGWTYALDGGLANLPGSEAYGPGFDAGQLSLTAVPRVASYRGFVFASFASNGPSLDDYLGPAKQFIDVVVDYSPSGRIRVRPGMVHRTRYRGNWKQVGMDGYHVDAVHGSALDIMQSRRESTGSAVGALQIENPWSDESPSRTVGMPYGHAALDLREQRLRHGDRFMKEVASGPGGQEYVAAMVARHGPERARDIIALHGDPHVGIFPNLQLIHDHIRVVVPQSVDETLVLMYPIMLEGVPPAMNTARLRHHEDFYGPAGFGSPDDIELFERTQAGARADSDPWIYVGRGLAREYALGGMVAGKISDEVTQRAQLQEWRRLMSLDAGPEVRS